MKKSSTKPHRGGTPRTPKVTLEAATAVLKQQAKQQKVRIKLTQEQLDAILSQWDEGDATKPAEVTFFVGRSKAAGFNVAGYRYRGNTCCV